MGFSFQNIFMGHFYDVFHKMPFANSTKNVFHGIPSPLTYIPYMSV